MRKLSPAQISVGCFIAQCGWLATVQARTAATMAKAGYIVDTKTSDSGPVWRFTFEGLYAWAKQAPAWATRNVSPSYIEDAEREAHIEDLERTAARICPEYRTEQPTDALTLNDFEDDDAEPQLIRWMRYWP